MEKRRTRGRPQKFEEPPVAITSTSRRVSQASDNSTAPPRSPVRRSSRPRSAASVNTVNITSDPQPMIIEDEKEEIIITSSKSVNNLPVTLTTNTESHSTPKSFVTSSVYTSSSTTTQKVVETHDLHTVLEDEGGIRRRSVPKEIEIPIMRQRSVTPSTEARASRYSRSVSRSMFGDDDDNASRGGFSEQGALLEEDEVDDNVDSFRTAHIGPRQRSMGTLKTFGLSLAVFLMMKLTPPLIYYLQWACSKRACEFLMPNWSALGDAVYLTRDVFRSDVVGSYVGFFFAILSMSALMPGLKVRLYGDRTQRLFNALPIGLVVTISFGVATYLQYPVVKYVLSNYLRFSLYSMVSASVLGFWCYLSPLLSRERLRRAHINVVGADEDVEGDEVQINVSGNTGNFFVDFALGRQVNPKWFGCIDMKLCLRRVSLMILLSLALCCLGKSIKLPTTEETNIWPRLLFYATNMSVNKARLFTASLLFLYASNVILFERFMASSYEVQAEGLGLLLLLRYAAAPYLLAAPAKYYADRQQATIDNSVVMVSGLIFVIGLALKTFSDAMKYKYRLDPLDPNFAYVASVHTFRGKRLLLGPLWGRMRHPNYAGELLILLALGLPVALAQAWPPVVGLLLLAILLLHRVARVGSHNSSNYSLSWLRYCDEVRYRVLPKVY